MVAGKLFFPLGILCVALLAHSATFKFYKYIFNSYPIYKESSIFLLSTAQHQPEWQITELPGDKYQVRVVIIGESVRKDYLSVYGYPHDTTPFLNTAPGYFLDGFISTAPNTSTSLPRTLSITTGGASPDPAHNVVTLANAAGLETWWISNQGTLGVHDVGVAAIAARSQHRIFLKSGDYGSENKDDALLLEKLEIALEDADKSRKLIFLHMMGSHPHECKRLHGYPVNFATPYGERFNCYLASIEKTDDFIRKAQQMLQQTGQSYSLVYFSDHGMLTTQIAGSSEYFFKHGSTYRQNYDVPFFILSSDAIEHIMERKNISAFRFIDFFAHWINVATQYTETGYDVRAVANDPDAVVFNFSTLVPYAQLKSQAALH